MAVRHWHPLKLIIVWAVGAGLVWVLVSMLNECGPCTNTGLVVLLSLFLATILTVIVITWKWASGREHKAP